METLEAAINWMNGYIWSWPPEPLPPLLVVLLVGSGIFITVRLGGIQLFKFGHAIKSLRGHYDSPEDRGDIKPHEALTSALSATVGIGNIAGVATAIHYGGPGALFWMWITAIFGMATKYAEAVLGVKYRQVAEDGSMAGGPMYYCEKGIGGRFGRFLGMFFAFTGALARKRGRFERANGGTILLDEIGEMPLEAQVRLLRVLQHREIERLGGTDRIPVVEDHDGIGAHYLGQRSSHGIGQGGRPALHLGVDQVSEDLGVGLRGEDRPAADQLLTQSEVVLDDAVVNHADGADLVRVSVFI